VARTRPKGWCRCRRVDQKLESKKQEGGARKRIPSLVGRRSSDNSLQGAGCHTGTGLGRPITQPTKNFNVTQRKKTADKIRSEDGLQKWASTTNPSPRTEKKRTQQAGCVKIKQSLQYKRQKYVRLEME